PAGDGPTYPYREWPQVPPSESARSRSRKTSSMMGSFLGHAAARTCERRLAAGGPTASGGPETRVERAAGADRSSNVTVSFGKLPRGAVGHPATPHVGTPPRPSTPASSRGCWRARSGSAGEHPPGWASFHEAWPPPTSPPAGRPVVHGRHEEGLAGALLRGLR